MLKFIIFVNFLICASLCSAQIFISPKQSELKEDSEEYITTGEKKIIIRNDSLFIGIPGSELTFEAKVKKRFSKDDKMLIFDIEGGGLINIEKDNIFANLKATKINRIFTYYFDNYIESSETQKIAEKKQNTKEADDFLQNLQVKYLGKFTAECIQQNIVKIGMKSEAVRIILGKPLDYTRTETHKKTSEYFAYPNQNIYAMQGFVILIKTSE